MRISRKLAICALATSTGLVLVAGIGMASITSIQGKLETLTLKATPMQAKTLEVQERHERMLGALFKLGVAASTEEVAKLAAAVDADLKDVARINTELRALDPSAARDPVEFQNARTQIGEAVSRKIGQVAAYRKETDAIKALVQQADASISTVRSGMAALESDSTRAAESAQKSSDELGTTIKALLSIQARMKDISLIVADTDAVTNRFRLAPLKERMKAQADSIQQIGGSKNEDALVREARTVAASLLDAFSKDAGGMVALRAEVLSGKKESDTGYQKARKGILAGIDELLGKISASVDALEGQIVKQRQVLEVSSRFRADSVATIALSNEISVDVKELVSGIRLLMLATNNAEVELAHTGLKQGDRRLQANLDKLRVALAKMSKADLSRNAATAAAALKPVAASLDRVAKARLDVIASETAVDSVMQKLKVVAAEQSAAGERQVKGIAGRQAETVATVNSEVEHALTLLLVIALVVIAGSIALSVGTMRSITRPLRESLNVANLLASGDLRVKITATGKDEIGELQVAMRDMVGKLSGVVSEVKKSAESLSNASSEVSSTAQTLSQAATEQAASVEETSASIEQMTASIAQNTENAKVTDGMAAKAAGEATEGGEAVKATVAAMKQIAGKIGIIDDIAYQTNLLALNAAIEAARAGEHGKGFAVVAAEVRKLAERSQKAAQEIGEVAGSSVELAVKAGALLDAMVPNIRRTSDLLQEITAASQEQSSGAGQINGAITQLNAVTQKNAAGSEELAATAEEMSSQAEQLKNAVDFFKLAAEEAAPVPQAKILKLPKRKAPVPKHTAKTPAPGRYARNR